MEGTNFSRRDGVVSCKFTPGGTTHGINVFQNIVACVSPELTEANDVDIELSFNSKDYIHSLNQFTYF